jgi:hypothetical protein
VPVIGGVAVTAQQAEHALAVLRSSPGMMVRQPLQRAGNPLAACDYHAVAAPYRKQSAGRPPSGRGAAGRHLTKPAFVIAVESALAAERQAGRRRAETEAAVSALQPPVPPGDIEAALAAFTSDHSYAALMAAAAVALLRKRHQTSLRAQLREASSDAVASCARLDGRFQCAAAAPCGTGDCRLARGVLAGLAVPDHPAPFARGGLLRRPGNHVQAGCDFSADAMLGVLQEARPWRAAAS